MVRIDCDNFIDRLSLVLEANQALVQTESLKELFPAFLRIAESATTAEASSYLRYDSDARLLCFEVVRNSGASADVERLLKGNVTVPLGVGIAGTCALNRESILVENAREDERVFKQADRASGYETRSLLCVPVEYQDELLGVIQVLNPRSRQGFDDGDRLLLENFASMAAVAVVRARFIEESVRKRQMEAELSIVAKIQAKCWPAIPELGNGYSVWGKSVPAREVGGDLYDFIPMPDGSLIGYVADVSGKGLAAGFIMSALWSSFRSHVHEHGDTGTLLSAVNNDMYGFLEGEGFFATAYVFRLYPDTGRIYTCSAGHHAPYFEQNGSLVRLSTRSGVPVGVVPEYRYRSDIHDLAPGGRLVVTTDGLSEAFSGSGEMFGDMRVRQCILECGDMDCGERLMSAVQDFVGADGIADDATIIELRRKI